jgi:HlyD family secretion protein
LRLRLSFIFLIALTVCCGCKNDSAQAGQPAGSGARGADGQRGGRGGGSSEISVHATGVQRISIQRQIDFSGTLQSMEQVKVSSEVAGTVLEAGIEMGQEVKAGQVLVRLDSRELSLALDRAESALRQTEAQLGIDSTKPTAIPPDEQIASVRTAIANRDDAKAKFQQSQELHNKGLVPRLDMDTNETRFKVSEANLQAALEAVRSLKASLQDRRAAVQLAQKKLEDATVRAPVNGAIAERLVQRGEYIRENTQVVTIVQLNPLQLHTAVQEKFSDLIRQGLSVQFAVEPFPNQVFNGRIANISPSIDQQTRTFPVDIQVDNANHKLKPGFFAKGVIQTGKDSNVMAVPDEAVSTLAGVSSVFVIAGNVIRQQSVTLGAHEGTLNEVVEGLKGDESIAISNLNQLVTGTKVKVATAEANVAPPRSGGEKSGGTKVQGERGSRGKDSK